MIGSGEAEPRAVVGAVRGAVGQARLDAGVNITGLLIDIELADDGDCRRHFMCWHLTRALGPSLSELVPPAVVRFTGDYLRPRGVPLARVSPASTSLTKKPAGRGMLHRSLAMSPSPPARRAANTT